MERRSAFDELAMDTNSDMLRMLMKKLNANNYHLWSNKQEVVIRDRGLWCFVDATEPARGLEDEPATQLNKYKEI